MFLACMLCADRHAAVLMCIVPTHDVLHSLVILERQVVQDETQLAAVTAAGCFI